MTKGQNRTLMTVVFVLIAAVFAAPGGRTEAAAEGVPYISAGQDGLVLHTEGQAVSGIKYMCTQEEYAYTNWAKFAADGQRDRQRNTAEGYRVSRQYEDGAVIPAAYTGWYNFVITYRGLSDEVFCSVYFENTKTLPGAVFTGDAIKLTAGDYRITGCKYMWTGSEYTYTGWNAFTVEGKKNINMNTAAGYRKLTDCGDGAQITNLWSGWCNLVIDYSDGSYVGELGISVPVTAAGRDMPLPTVRMEGNRAVLDDNGTELYRVLYMYSPVSYSYSTWADFVRQGKKCTVMNGSAGYIKLDPAKASAVDCETAGWYTFILKYTAPDGSKEECYYTVSPENGTPVGANGFGTEGMYAVRNASYVRDAAQGRKLSRGTASVTLTIRRGDRIEQGSYSTGGFSGEADLEMNLEVTEGYCLPYVINVISGAKTLKAGTDYEYMPNADHSLAELVIFEESLTGDVTVTAAASDSLFEAVKVEAADFEVPAFESCAVTSGITEEPGFTYTYRWYLLSDAEGSSEKALGSASAKTADLLFGGVGTGTWYYRLHYKITRNSDGMSYEGVSGRMSVRVVRNSLDAEIAVDENGTVSLSRNPDKSPVTFTFYTDAAGTKPTTALNGAFGSGGIPTTAVPGVSYFVRAHAAESRNFFEFDCGPTAYDTIPVIPRLLLGGEGAVLDENGVPVICVKYMYSASEFTYSTWRRYAIQGKAAPEVNTAKGYVSISRKRNEDGSFSSLDGLSVTIDREGWYSFLVTCADGREIAYTVMSRYESADDHGSGDDSGSGSGSGGSGGGSGMTLVVVPVSSGFVDEEDEDEDGSGEEIIDIGEDETPLGGAVPAGAAEDSPEFLEELTKGYTFKKGNGYYKVIKTGKANVVYLRPAKSKSTITIPDTVKYHGIVYKVVWINAKAFYKDTKIKTVNIGSNITKIGKKAFCGCKRLKTVNIPSKVWYTGYKAFYGCTKLNSITIDTKLLTEEKTGKKSFMKIPASATVLTPAGKEEVYSAILQECGLNRKADVIGK